MATNLMIILGSVREAGSVCRTPNGFAAPPPPTSGSMSILSTSPKLACPSWTSPTIRVSSSTCTSTPSSGVPASNPRMAFCSSCPNTTTAMRHQERHRLPARRMQSQSLWASSIVGRRQIYCAGTLEHAPYPSRFPGTSLMCGVIRRWGIDDGGTGAFGWRIRQRPRPTPMTRGHADQTDRAANKDTAPRTTYFTVHADRTL